MQPRRPAHVAEWMKLAPSQRAAWVNLLAVHRAVVARLDARISADHALGLAEWDLLVRLSMAPEGLRMGDLADLVLLSPSGVTRMVERLEERGLVERRRGAEDARETFARVTRKGLDLLAKAAPTHNDELKERFLAPLTQAEAETLGELLAKIARANGVEQTGGPPR